MPPDAYEDWIAENAAALLRSLHDSSPPTRRVTLTWPDKATEGDAFQLTYLPPAVSLLFEQLESGCEYEVTIRKKS